MKQYFLTCVCLFGVLACYAQQSLPVSELRQNPLYAASNTLAYPGPKQQRLTPAPHGKKPFYLSHYGRHGSRYLTKVQDYDYLLGVLDRAEREQKLSGLGLDLLRRVRLLQAEAQGRIGDLTPLGFQQSKDIARRMIERFPEVFKGAATVDARSTMVPRCILSMSAALQQMVALNPKLQVVQDASMHDLGYMNFHDRKLIANGSKVLARKCYKDYCEKRRFPDRVVQSLFCDTGYVRKLINSERINYYLFRLAGDVQNTPLGQQLSLYDFFTPEEIFANWQKENALWYLSYAHAPQSGGLQPFSQRHLLRRIISQADSCIRLAHPGAHLRYGHETIVLPLACLMGIDGYDARIEDLDSLEQRGWVNYCIYPMGCNIQMVFYRKNPHDSDVLVKVLLNENEATLPIESSMAPYYRWADVRDYYLRKLDSYPDDDE